MSKKTIKPLTLAISAAFVGSLALSTMSSASENPFSMTAINAETTITVAAKDGKCGEGKCGKKKDATKKKDGKCGGAKKKDGKCGGTMKKSDKKKDGKCGEGKCGKK